MKRMILILIAIALLIPAQESRAQWKMRVHENGTVTDFAVTGIDSITFYKLADIGWVFIAADIFTMGSPADEPERYSNETQHLVTLTNDFYMSEKRDNQPAVCRYGPVGV